MYTIKKFILNVSYLRVTVLILIVLIALLAASVSTVASASAASASGSDLSRVTAGERLPRFVDDEGLLTAAQAAELTAKLDDVSERHQFDTVVAVVRELDTREARLYAADFFEQNGFGFGDELDGAILLLATQDRDFGFVSFGFGLNAFTPAGQAYLDEFFLPHLRENNYYAAFIAYADAVDDFLTKAESGKPYDTDNIPRLTDSERATLRVVTGVISAVLALIIAFVVTLIWRLQLKSVRSRNLALEYIRPGSMVINIKKDAFLYRKVQKHRKPQESGSGGGGGRGGGSFSSSSGRSSTGHSGKY